LPPRSRLSPSRLAASVLAGLVLVGAGAARPLAAGDPANSAYAAQVGEALTLTRQALTSGDHDAEQRAAALLVVDGVDTQPEIQARLRDGGRLNDLDVESRLLELQAALRAEAKTPDPAAAAAKLRAILADGRYQPQQPSLFDRFVQWVVQRLADLLRGLHAGGGGSAPPLLAIEVAVAAVILLLLLFFLARAGIGRGAGLAVRARRRGRASSADEYFEAADRMAAAGDWSGALRALAGGVATRLGGPGAWEHSPLTVRELFRARGLLERLRPVLVPFEAAMYGHRGVDRETYERAAAVAAPYRSPAAEEDEAAGGGRP